jgi:hypothetical protein
MAGQASGWQQLALPPTDPPARRESALARWGRGDTSAAALSALRIRGESAPDDDFLVVRGDELTAETLRLDAERTHTRFGEFGVSVMGGRDDAALDDLARTVLRRFELLTVMTAGGLRRVGLELRPTFRRPHYTVMLPELDEDVDRLLRCDNEIRINPYFDADEVQR